MGNNTSISNHLPFWIRITLTAIGWVLVIAVLHKLSHEYSQLLTQILSHPVLKAVGAMCALSLLIYLVILSLPAIKKPGWRGILTIFAWSALVIIGHGVTHLGESNAGTVLKQLNEMMGLSGFILLALSYSLFLAMPFVAAVEIGLLIMAIFGVPGVIVAYTGTIVGLNLAFSIGRLLPDQRVHQGLEKIGLSVENNDFDGLLERLVAGSGWLSKLGGFLLRHRYIALGVCFNFPGNSLIGGGGGLSILSGLSKRLVSWPLFVLVTVIATLPVPLLVLFGFLSVGDSVEHGGQFHDLMELIYGWFFNFSEIM